MGRTEERLRKRVTYSAEPPHPTIVKTASLLANPRATQNAPSHNDLMNSAHPAPIATDTIPQERWEIDIEWRKPPSLVGVFLMIALLPALEAQPVGIPAAPVASTTSADVEWETLRSQWPPKPTSATPDGGKRTAAERNAEDAAAFRAQAERLRLFRKNNPGHPAAPTARQRELLAMIFAARRGDRTQDAHRAELLDEVRKDPDLSPTLRCEAVAWSKQAAIAAPVPGGRAAYLAEQAKVATELIQEFPVVADGYEALVAVARDSDPTAAMKILADVRGMTAPPWVKQEAVFQQERFSLIGRSFAQILGFADQVPLIAPTKGRTVVVYAWSRLHQESYRLPRKLAAKTPAAFFLGICLDADNTAARQAAVNGKLPGTQSFSQSGASARLPATLKLRRPGEILLVDSAGTVREVNGADDAQAKLNRLMR